MLLTLMLDIVSGMVRAFRYLFVFTGLCPLSQAALVACFTYVAYMLKPAPHLHFPPLTSTLRWHAGVHSQQEHHPRGSGAPM